MRFQEVCEGNLIQWPDDIMEALEKKFLIRPVRFKSIHHIEEPEYSRVVVQLRCSRICSQRGGMSLLICRENIGKEGPWQVIE